MLLFEWWLVPLMVTLTSWAGHFWIHRKNILVMDFGFIGEVLSYAATFCIALILSLIAWLIYFIVT